MSNHPSDHDTAGDGNGTVPAPAPVPPPPRWSKTTVAVVIALALLACGVGVGIGYAVDGTATTPGPQRTTTTTTGTGATASIGASRLSAIKADVAPELVNINTTLGYRTLRGAGTGMVVTSSGRVITNNHVIAGATNIKATDLGNGKTYDVSVVGYDVSDDVAVLQLDGASGLATVQFAGSRARLGDTVVAIGNARGAGIPTAAAGVVTGLDQTITAQSELTGISEHLGGLIETNAAIQSGQSGGPLLNAKGRVVGMVTAGSAGFEFSQSASQGYAVPAHTFRSIAGDIVRGRESGTVHIGATALLGVMVTSTQVTGALVVQVLSTSPAADAGIVPGEIIVGLGGQAIRSPGTVSSLLAAHDPGATLQVRLLDVAGGERTVTVTLVAGPPA